MICCLGISPLLLGHTYLLHTELKGNLEQTLRRACHQHPDPRHGVALASTVARLLRWRGDVAKVLQPHDQIRIVYEQGEGEPNLAYLDYQGSQIQLTAIRFHPQDGSEAFARYYTPKGIGVEPVMLESPTAYEAITELVLRKRGHRRHDGIDLKAPIGTPIYARRGGRIQRRNWLTRFNGLCLEIVQQDGLVARYLHLHRLAPNMQVGRYLEPGVWLGDVGTTGRSNGPHLHYELWRDGRAIEPLDYHGRDVRHLDAQWLPQLNHEAAIYQGALADLPPNTWQEISPTPSCVPLHPVLLPPLGCSNWFKAWSGGDQVVLAPQGAAR